MEKNDKQTIDSLECVLRSAYEFFREVDKDNSGYLEAKEIMRFMNECDITVSEESCKNCINELDTNGDGVLDFPEFMAFLGSIYSAKLKIKKLEKEKRRKKRMAMSKK